MHSWRQLIFIHQLSILKTAYYTMKFRGLIIIGKGTKISLSRDAKIVVTTGRLSIGVSTTLDMPQVTYLEIAAGGLLHINGEASIMKGCRIEIHNGAVVSIGDHFFMNERSKITCYEYISIGKKCIVGWDVNIVDTDVHHIIVDGKSSESTKRVTINDNVWIGFNAVILKGVSIGNGSVIGAGSVVTKDVSEHCLSVGNPSEVIRRNIAWEV